VVYRKFDGSLHWHLTMRYLGEDEHGIWVGMRPGGVMRKGDGPEVPIPHANIGLLPHGVWWTAWFNGEPERVDTYCDITTPPQWVSEEEVTMIDLDLDVARVRADGSVVLFDEDEFAEHRVKYGYPEEVAANAQAAAGWLQSAIASGAEPFSTVYKRWLALVE
jgi:protein associated with RNAse G/E